MSDIKNHKVLTAILPSLVAIFTILVVALVRFALGNTLMEALIFGAVPAFFAYFGTSYYQSYVQGRPAGPPSPEARAIWILVLVLALCLFILLETLQLL